MVYVDDMNFKYRGMIMCHMIADTTKELLDMVDSIGVNKKWIQEAGTWKEHFDICLVKKKTAIELGAQEISKREMAVMRAERKTKTIQQ